MLHRLDRPVPFESLLADLSATFVNLPATQVDSQIGLALRRLVEFLGMDRGGLAKLLIDQKQLVLTHSYHVPGAPPDSHRLLHEELPWYTQTICQGEILRLSALPDDLPPPAVEEREYCLRVGMKAHVMIPLKVMDGPVGAIGFASFRSSRDWPDELVRRLRLVGDIFANALARQQADQALRQTEERYRDLLETTQAVPWEVDAQTLRYRYVGPQVVALLGYPVEHWYQEGFWAAHLHPDDRLRILRFCSEILCQGEHHTLEYRMRAASGKTVWIHDLITVASQDGTPRTIRGMRIDITARKAAEEEAHRLREQLSRVARVTMLGELAAAIAHEVNQPLCALVTNAQTAQCLLAEDPPEVGEARETLQEIVADSRRASEILARIRTLLQKRQPEQAPVDLKGAIREVAALLQYQLTQKGVSLSLHLAADLPPVLGDRVLLQQVLLNLLLNAIEAMGQVHAGRPELLIHAVRDEGGAVAVSVRDSGPGLASEDTDQIFEPCFTTKPSGMGIGLAISRSVVEAHGGRIWAEPNPGGGAAFHFTLPATRETSP